MAIFLSLGSNLGDRVENIERGLAQLAENKEIVILRRSRYYETSPVDRLDQPDFVNNVVEIATTLIPEELLEKIKLIEPAFISAKRTPKGPRVLDIDIVMYHDQLRETESLTLPHPSMCQRKFVMIPLLEIKPDASCLRHNRPLSECLAQLNDEKQQVELYDG